MAVETSFSRAREHPRWRTLVGSSDKPQPAQQHRQQRRQQLKQHFGISSTAISGALSDRAAHDVKGKSKARPSIIPSTLGPNYSASEHTLRNDYSQHFVDTSAGLLPGNAVRNPSSSTRFDEYPKLKRLVQLKDALVARVAHPPTYLRVDLRPSLEPFRDPSRSTATFHLGSLIPVKYDVVLIDPPLEAYEWEAYASASTSASTGAQASTWSWEEIAALPVPQLAAKESFVFLWVGSGAGDGLERGREVLAKWGYRRCEDIVCIRTNPQTGSDAGGSSSEQPSTSSAFTRSSQHCLMGIRGTVRRSTDTRFVHCNIDTDVMLWPGPDDEQPAAHLDTAGPRRKLPDMTSKPPELYSIIENFCLGTRRLELFGRNSNLRRGWLTIGLELGPDAPRWPEDGKVELPSAGLPVLQEEAAVDQGLRMYLDALRTPRVYEKIEYDSNFGVDRPGCDLRDRSNLVPYVEEVDQLRPKSPPPRGAPGTGGNGNSINSTRYREAPQQLSAQGPMAMPNGLSSNPALRSSRQASPSHPAALPLGLDCANPSSSLLTSGLPPRAPVAGGAGFSGLGAGGARTVSVPSGSETLSGPQASVLKAKAIAEANVAAYFSASAAADKVDDAPVAG
ncbi:hypothetical protein NDA11_003171 [Ustilago hordei]|uniref:Uncharacterized protein n=1 Tax=Ustilago hordei TaxID=120017 RepID=I2G554_USTHO|nr:related to KAR4 - transcription factor required for gene regulation in response to pheromones [Ustilago hordei]KAJ1044778.1 hypothetical protein NDA10_005467 [Ustilago hordei]KAJ1586627.1 hypothetical protein NDA11_003171 [Ustilago hordei]KAJ1603113.1 hypothetical protein NDA14_003707 [Ustilago hordei]UTT94609.1 hypothetical protein NDA17_001268 [Ustilago hordei]CCF54297.1 uncharacterized protein UHOR_03945 [Ustilago hordei]